MAPGRAKGYLHDAADVDHWQVQFEAPLPGALPDPPPSEPAPTPPAPSGVLTPDALIPDAPSPQDQARPAPLILSPRPPKAAPGRLIDARLSPLKPALKLELGWRWSVAGGSAENSGTSRSASGVIMMRAERGLTPWVILARPTGRRPGNAADELRS